MKSFCVLNSAVTPAAARNIGAACAQVLGGKLGVLYCGSDLSFATAQNISDGIKKQGGFALLAGDAFEAQTAFACEHYALDGVVFISGDKKCSISVYSSGAGILSPAQEEEISCLASKEKLNGHRGGVISLTDLNCAYYKHMLDAAESLEGVAVKIKSENLIVRTHIVRTVLALGGEIKGRAAFFVSPSGFCLSAVDECGKIHTHDELLSVLYALIISQEKRGVEVPFSLYGELNILAEENGVEIRRSFSGGNELFAKDSLLLAVMLLRYMSQIGCGLNELCAILSEKAVSRKSFTSKSDLLKIADEIECEQLVTDGNSIYAKVQGSDILITQNIAQGRYCLEVQATDSETANEIALNLTELYK